MGRDGQKSKLVTVRLDKELHDFLAHRAKRAKRSMSQELRELLIASIKPYTEMEEAESDEKAEKAKREQDRQMKSGGIEVYRPKNKEQMANLTKELESERELKELREEREAYEVSKTRQQIQPDPPRLPQVTDEEFSELLAKGKTLAKDRKKDGDYEVEYVKGGG